mmetsp:Transcript_65144/g.183363  ORF Transcript_65144/g.183363 Transcript_65144/m.183363 type:complete len:230 (-) Transcript_65144:117-806(-)
MACFCCGSEPEAKQPGIDPVAEDYSRANANAKPVLPQDGGDDGKTEAPADFQRFAEYTVLIARPPGARMGLELDIMDYKTAQVCEVADGCVKEHNGTAAADRRVEVGDFIIAVNGQRGDAKVLLKMLKEDARLELLFRRPIEYHVKIDSGGRSLGMTLQHAPRSISLLIAEVREGPVAEWTARNPSRPVRSYDRIVEVNGNRTVPAELLNEIQDSTLAVAELKLISVLD